MVLGKQETRVKENLKEVENKINQMIRGTQSTNSGTSTIVKLQYRGKSVLSASIFIPRMLYRRLNMEYAP